MLLITSYQVSNYEEVYKVIMLRILNNLFWIFLMKSHLIRWKFILLFENCSFFGCLKTYSGSSTAESRFPCRCKCVSTCNCPHSCSQLSSKNNTLHWWISDELACDNSVVSGDWLGQIWISMAFHLCISHKSLPHTNHESHVEVTLDCHMQWKHRMIL